MKGFTIWSWKGRNMVSGAMELLQEIVTLSGLWGDDEGIIVQFLEPELMY